MAKQTLYDQLIHGIFFHHYHDRAKRVPFKREDIYRIAEEVDVPPPKNPGDLIYTYRFRRSLPDAIRDKAPAGQEWVIRLAGDGLYRFEATANSRFTPNQQLASVKVPDATPGLIERYALTDEQALLAILRYNRLIDIFTGVTCYSLQSHLRTKVEDIGQGEIDEVYVGLNRSGVHYVLPVQAKGGRDQLGVVQIEQDLLICRARFPALVCRPVGAQFLESKHIALFEFIETDTGAIQVAREGHYRLVKPQDITDRDLEQYRRLIDGYS